MKNLVCCATVDKVEIVQNPENVDWLLLFDLLQQSFSNMNGRINPPSSLHKMNAQTLRNKASEEELFVAMAGEGLVGCMFCRISSDFMYIGKLATLPSHQGHGIGRR